MSQRRMVDVDWRDHLTASTIVTQEGSAVRRFGDTAVTTERLALRAIVPEDADEMACVLDDERLHEYIGGRPASLDELRARYQKFATGSSRPEEIWLNRVVRHLADDQAVGTMQATVIDRDVDRIAYIAWVIGVPWQNAGFATEAAQALVTWLSLHGVVEIVAHVRPDHRASAIVAARAGLTPTDASVDGERVWRTKTAIESDGVSTERDQ